MRKAAISLAVLLFSLARCVPALSLMIKRDLDHSQVPSSPDWPAGLKELVSRQGRVYGRHLDAPTFGRGYEQVSIYFAGDSKLFNEFVQEYSRLKGTPLTLILHAGRGAVSPLAIEKRRIFFDWQVNISRYLPPKASDSTEKPEPGYTVSVEMWLGGNLELYKVNVPLNVEVKSDGEIEKFVAGHEAKRKKATSAE
jgi:hypothetical protein